MLWDCGARTPEKQEKNPQILWIFLFFYTIHAHAMENNFDISSSDREFMIIGTLAPMTTPPKIQSPKCTIDFTVLFPASIFANSKTSAFPVTGPVIPFIFAACSEIATSSPIGPEIKQPVI